MFDIEQRLIDTERRAEDVWQEILVHKWYHRFNFSGMVTPGYDPTDTKLAALELGEDMTGKTVIDVGTVDGFFAFECERRGATVLATDDFLWREEPGFLTSFQWVNTLLGNSTPHMQIPVEDMTPESVGTFDVVLFMGVLYHTKDPLGYLERMRAITKEIMILETYVDLLNVPVPAAAFYVNGALAGDTTSYWGPNELAVRDLCIQAGFSKCEYRATWSQNIREKLEGRWPGGPVTNGRMVFYAYP